MNEKDVFISYSSHDRAFATVLYKELSAYGVSVWMDVADIPPGYRWDRVIQEALETCTHLVLVHTQASFESDNVWDEWSFFLQRNKPVIPLIVEDVSLPFRLERVHHVDFCTQAFDHAIRQLVQVLPHFEPTEPSPTPGLVLPRQQMAQRRERAGVFEDRNVQDMPPQRGRRSHSLANDDPDQDAVFRSNAVQTTAVYERFHTGSPPRDRRSNPPESQHPFAEGSDRAPRASASAPWIEEAESLVDSRFSHAVAPLTDLNRQTIGDDKPTRAPQLHDCSVNGGRRPRH